MIKMRYLRPSQHTSYKSLIALRLYHTKNHSGATTVWTHYQ